MPDFYLEPIFKAQSAHSLENNNNGDDNVAAADNDGKGDGCGKPEMKTKRKSKILKKMSISKIFRKNSTQKVTPEIN